MGTRYARRLTPLAVMATLLMTNTASAEPAVEVGPVADLVANGAQVDIPLSVVCDPAGPGGTRNIVVQVRQAGRNVVASGSGYRDDVPCDGGPQETTVSALADPGSRPFRAGDAAVQASLAVCSVPPGAPGATGPKPTDVTPPGTPAPEPPGPGPAPEPPAPGPTPPPGATPPAGDIFAPCQTVTVSAVVLFHPVDSGGHPRYP